MEIRYEETPSQVKDLCESVRISHFSALDGANVMYIFDTKKKSSGGRIVMAHIKKMNDEMKFLAMDNMGLTYDYVMVFDKAIWEALDETDRKRIIFHEFCHCDVNFDKANPYGLRDHEIQGFYDEADFNVDDPRWYERLAVIAESIHDPENNSPEEPKE